MITISETSGGRSALPASGFIEVPAAGHLAFAPAIPDTSQAAPAVLTVNKGPPTGECLPG